MKTAQRPLPPTIDPKIAALRARRLAAEAAAPPVSRLASKARQARFTGEEIRAKLSGLSLSGDFWTDAEQFQTLMTEAGFTAATELTRALRGKDWTQEHRYWWNRILGALIAGHAAGMVVTLRWNSAEYARRELQGKSREELQAYYAKAVALAHAAHPGEDQSTSRRRPRS